MSNVSYVINRQKDSIVLFDCRSSGNVENFESIYAPYPDALLSELNDAVKVNRLTNNAGEIYSKHEFSMLKDTVIKLNNRVVDLIEGDSMI